MSTNLKIILFPNSSNAKTGNIIQSYSSRATCPEKCPAQTHADRNCKECRLCARDRKTTVIFGIHGTTAKKAAKVIMMKQVNN